jgi:hypothetical protein
MDLGAEKWRNYLTAIVPWLSWVHPQAIFIGCRTLFSALNPLSLTQLGGDGEDLADNFTMWLICYQSHFIKS